MKDLMKIRKMYELKSIYRKAKVGTRHESSAEHTWSSMMLADYLFRYVKNINRLRVYELLLYHDIAEIQTGDIPYLKVKDRKSKEKAFTTESQRAQIFTEKSKANLQ